MWHHETEGQINIQKKLLIGINRLPYITEALILILSHHACHQMTHYRWTEIKLLSACRFRVGGMGGQQTVVMAVVVDSSAFRPSLVFKQQASYSCCDRPACLPFSLQNRRAERKQLHCGPSGIHAEMKLSNASGPRTDFLMCEGCTVFTDVFCLHFWTC